MAAAPNDIGRAEYDGIAAISRGACGFLIYWKFGDADALMAKIRPHGRALIVMREHPYIGGTRRFGQPRDRFGDFVAAAHDIGDEAIEGVVRKSGALDHAGPLVRFVEAGDSRIHVVVEREQIDASFGQPLSDLDFSIPI